MVRYFEKTPKCRVVIVEKTDRLYRNLRDCLTLEDLDIEIHLPKEGQIISKDARSQAKLIHGIHVVMARSYIENLREEVKKGMREKAEQGIYTSRPPVGYRNNKAEHTIEVDPEKAPLARRILKIHSTRDRSFGKAKHTSAPRPHSLTGLCSNRCRQYSMEGTSQGIRSTILRSGDC
jgi:site-specific DNA recombinase